MLDQLLPRTIDNDYRGRKAALWLLGLLLLMKTGMGLNSIINGYKVASSADGIPLDTYPPAAAGTIVALFGIWGLGHFMLCLLGILILVRYRRMVPFMFALFLVEQLSRKLILRLHPIARTGNPPASAINLALLALMVVGLALSLWHRSPSKETPMTRITPILLIATLSATAGAQTTDAPALARLGRDAITHGEPLKAAEHLEKAVALEPNNAGYHYQLANAYGMAAVNAGMFKAMSLARKLKAELTRAVQLDPNLIPARFALLEFSIAAPAIAGGSESAALEQATEIRKRDAIDGHRAFARIHTAAKKPDLARKEYADMVKEQPASARAHYFSGVYQMLTEKNYKAASDEFESALRLDPAYMPAYFQIGHAAALAGNNFARGEETLKKYLGYRPKDEEPSPARAYYWLGTIYEKQGNPAEAKSNYAASLKINPNQKDVDAAMKR